MEMEMEIGGPDLGANGMEWMDGWILGGVGNGGGTKKRKKRGCVGVVG